MGPVESISLDPESMRILETAYLLRPRSRADLESAVEPAHGFGERFDALCAGGFLQYDGGVLGFESPYAVFMALGRERARRMQEETDRTTALMQALPRLIRAWDISEVEDGGQHPLAVNIIHAVADSGDSWFRHAAMERPVAPSLVFPEATALDAALRANELPKLQALLTEGQSVRVLVDADIPLDGERGDLVAHAREQGVRFRGGSCLPSWFYVDAASIVGVPVLWGSAAPLRTLAIRTPPIVAAMTLLFDQLWDHSGRWGEGAPDWARTLELLAVGMTDEAVARALGLTPRTVRRRIAEAMVELGASSRFALGMAWRARSPAP